jgi:hypothetical protein
VAMLRVCVRLCVCAGLGLRRGGERKRRTCSWIAWLRTLRRTSR